MQVEHRLKNLPVLLAVELLGLADKADDIADDARVEHDRAQQGDLGLVGMGRELAEELLERLLGDRVAAFFLIEGVAAGLLGIAPVLAVEDAVAVAHACLR